MDVRTMAVALAAAALLATPASASATFVHVVAPGESLSSVAATDGLTVAQLAAANGVPVNTELIAGSQLAIPPQGEGSTVEGVAPISSGADGDGDSDDGVASEQASPASAAGAQPVGEAAAGSPEGPPDPTAETVSPEQVASIAAAGGVPSSLASAIADQESGFDNALTSSADARGVMQITPGTWSWIDQELAGSAPLAPASALDNVRGGVLLLHSLLESTGGDEALAAAGYFQGLPAVLENGEYPETQHYVEDVQALQRQFGGG